LTPLIAMLLCLVITIIKYNILLHIFHNKFIAATLKCSYSKFNLVDI
jgi:hypothetical protein